MAFLSRMTSLLEDSGLLEGYPGLKTPAVLSRITGVSEHAVRYWLRDGVVPRQETLSPIVEACLRRMGVRGLVGETTEWVRGATDDKPYEKPSVITLARERATLPMVEEQIERVTTDWVPEYCTLLPATREALTSVAVIGTIASERRLDDGLIKYIAERFIDMERAIAADRPTI